MTNESPSFLSAFAELLGLVTQATGLDLGQYKEATLRRQAIRRYQALGFASLEDYLAHAKDHPEELFRLHDAFLISVSSFFRDRSAFLALEQALRELILGKQEGDAIRVWVAGCATGEEAYSVAILLGEMLGDRLDRFDVRVFATDIDREALEFARAGVYASEELVGLNRERWFSPQNGGWRIAKTLRDLCVFSVHNVVNHPPFINMDLLTCRNLLIYLKQEQQETLLNVFHYALKPGGLLLLGLSESAGFKSRLFEVIDAHQRLYRHRPATPSFSRSQTWFAPPLASQPRPLLRAKPDLAPQSLEEVARSVLASYGPPGVLVNAKFEPLYFFGRSGRYFSVPGDTPDFSLFSLCPRELRTELKTLAYRMAWENLDTLRGTGALVRFDDGAAWAWPVLRRVKLSADNAEPAFLIHFEEHPARAAGAIPTESGQADATERLRQELADTREHLEAMIEAMEAANEEAQSLNEELQVSGEELQSSNEELQGSNEELKTLNEALRLKSEALDELNTTLGNIQNSICTGLVVTDAEGKITRFNTLAVRIFGLVAKDIGQLLYGVPCHLGLPRLREQINEVVGSGEVVVQRVHQGDFHYLMQIAPYINEFGARAGAVLTFTDITELHRAEEAQRSSEVRFRQVWDASTEGLLVANSEGRLVLVNPALEAMFGYGTGELIGQSVEILVPEALRAKHSDQRLSCQDRSGDTPIMGALRDVSGTRKDGSEFPVGIHLSHLTMDGADFTMAAIADITERHQARRRLEESQRQLALALEAGQLGFWDWDVPSGEIQFGGCWASMLGYAPGDIEPHVRSWERLVHPDEREFVMAVLTDHLEAMLLS